MKRTWKTLALAVLACASRAAAEGAAPAVTEGKIEVDHSGTKHAFVFAAKTSLPDGTRFDLQLYFVRRYKIPEGLVEPGQPDFDEELVELDKDDATSKDGAFGAEMGASDEAPWPGRYRVVVSWPDADAPGDDGTAHSQTDIETGDPRELPALRARVDREVYEDMARIGRILDGLKARWKVLGDGADATWKDFRADADRRINAVKERNGRRRKAEFYWMESRGKQRIDWTLQKLCPLLDRAGLYLPKPAADRPKAEELDVAIADAEEDYQHYLDFMGIGRIVDAGNVDAQLATVEKIAAEIGSWRDKAAADAKGWAEASTDLSTRLLDAALKLSGELPEAYFSRSESVQRAALRMLEHVRDLSAGRKPSTDWAELEKRLETASRELRASVPRIKDE